LGEEEEAAQQRRGKNIPKSSSNIFILRDTKNNDFTDVLME
jgi:hypothetical protein